MHKKLIKAMHWLVLTSLITILFVMAAYELDPYDYGDGSGELGNSLGYAFLYFWALVFGFIGWILAVFLLINQMRTRERYSRYAILYAVLGVVGGSLVFYFAQAG